MTNDLIAMRTGLTISTVGHAALLAWAAVLASGLFAAKPLDAPPTESMPVDVISATEFSQLRAGKLDAPKAEKPKPMAEKIAEAKPQTNQAQKVVDKPEIVSAFAPAPPPPELKVEPRKPAEAKAEPKAEPKPKEPEKAEPKPDPIAEALKQDEAKKAESKPEPKRAEVKKPDAKPEPKPEPKKAEVTKPQPKFSATQIAALLDKREGQRQAVTGDTLSHTPVLGTRTGDAPQLSASEMDAFAAKLKTCWNPPAGAPNEEKILVPMTIRLKPDRTLASPPQIEIRPRDALTQAIIESAVRALIQCQPYAMFAPQRYEVWKEIPLNFDPTFGG